VSERSGTRRSMAEKIWLRVKLPQKDAQSLQQEFPNCDLRQSDDAAVDPQWLPQIDGVFIEETIPDELVQRMTDLKCSTSAAAASTSI
jgi:hypothetical protein